MKCVDVDSNIIKKMVGFYENRQNPVGIGFASSSKIDRLNLKILKI
jgi:hypothetical protein